MTTRVTPLGTRHAHQRGISLIEALIAMVVLSLGLLGLAGLQISSLKFNQTASLRSKAVALAYDMQERVRASAQDFTAIPFAAYANTQITNWQGDVAAQLPGGVGAICRISDPANPAACDGGAFYVVSVTWNEANEARAARQAQTIQIVARE